MTKISFHGAAGTVTGSCYLLENETSKILVDCGLFQGSPELELQNKRPFLFDPKSINSILLTHAHLDHCGRLGVLVKNGFSGPIYMTAATQALLEIALLDAAHIMKEKNENEALYSKDDVLKLLSLSKIISYHQQFDIPEGYKITYVDAGHILGSASIILDSEGKRIVMSGDLGNTPQDLIRPTEFVESGDFVVMESTYGDTVHPIENSAEILTSEINAVEKSGGTLLIPAFSLERTQEILHKIEHLKKSQKVKADTPVYLDSPMAISATEIFRKFKDLYNSELNSHTGIDDPFSFTNLQVIYHEKESEKIKDIPGAKVIIAGSGMMTGGRIVNHAKTFLPEASTRLLFVGFQAEHTLGRQIIEGAKFVKIGGESINIRANINVSHAMSSHADAPRLVNWLGHIKNVKNICLTHGEDGPRSALKAKILKSQKIEVHTPYLGDKITI